MVWDRGTWTPEVPDVNAALAKGDFKFTLHGAKLKGSWVLVRTRGFGGKRSSWLLIKHRDGYASTKDIALEEPRSALSGRLLAEIAQAAGGNVEKAAAGKLEATEKQLPPAKTEEETVGKQVTAAMMKTAAAAKEADQATTAASDAMKALQAADTSTAAGGQNRNRPRNDGLRRRGSDSRGVSG